MVYKAIKTKNKLIIILLAFWLSAEYLSLHFLTEISSFFKVPNMLT